MTHPKELRSAALVCFLASLWTAITGTLSIVVGISVGSVALVGSGADVLTDVFASSFNIYRLRAQAKTGDYDHRRELLAHRVASVALLVVATLLGANAVLHVALGLGVAVTPPALILAAIGVVARPTFAALKYRAARRTGSKALAHDAHVMAIGGGMAGATLLSLALSAVGLAWVDLLAGAAFAVFAAQQGVSGLRHVRAEVRADRQRSEAVRRISEAFDVPEWIVRKALDYHSETSIVNA